MILVLVAISIDATTLDGTLLPDVIPDILLLLWPTVVTELTPQTLHFHPEPSVCTLLMAGPDVYSP